MAGGGPALLGVTFHVPVIFAPSERLNFLCPTLFNTVGVGPPPVITHCLQLPPVEVAGYSHIWRGVRWWFGLGRHLPGQWDASTIRISSDVTISHREPISDSSNFPEGLALLLTVHGAWE